jgi:hypothetical protein
MRLLPRFFAVTPTAAAAALLAACAGAPPANPMTFFVTSAGPGKGADLGGLAGADAHCQKLAAAVGAGNHTWRAYLSTSATASSPAANARDRIGKGPWRNAKGEGIANDIEQLHDDNMVTKQTALNEKGGIVNGRGDQPNTHDMLTGSSPDGRALGGDKDMTCGNWTKNTTDGAAMTGHHDRTGTSPPPSDKSWNSSHPSNGCSAEALPKTGGAGLFYCFAAD